MKLEIWEQVLHHHVITRPTENLAKGLGVTSYDRFVNHEAWKLISFLPLERGDVKAIFKETGNEASKPSPVTQSFSTSKLLRNGQGC